MSGQQKHFQYEYFRLIIHTSKNMIYLNSTTDHWVIIVYTLILIILVRHIIIPSLFVTDKLLYPRRTKLYKLFYRGRNDFVFGYDCLFFTDG